MSQAEHRLGQALAAYGWSTPRVEVARYGSGHINDTFCVYPRTEAEPHRRFILQRVSSAAFPHPEELMGNMVGVTAYLAETLAHLGENASRGTLTLVPTCAGSPFFTDEDGRVWRATCFIEGTKCYQSAETPELFYASAKAFGRFQRLLGAYPAHTLCETIERFHDTENRFRNLKKAVEADKLGRVKDAEPEIEFAMARQADCSVCMEALRKGVLPLRVTHNDTKLNNVLFDAETDAGICVIDLDTVMPGLSINDFGDSIRFGANHSAEDEQDLSKVNFDLDLYEIYTRGFLEEAASVLTREELDYMPWGAKLMTLECGIRFLTDYLEGDTYFRTSRPGQNLDRCRTQFKLVSDMEGCWEQMHRIVTRIAEEL